MKQLKVHAKFIEEVLGSVPSTPEVYSEYVASKAPEALSLDDEVASLGVEEVVEKSMTVFYREEGRPLLFDYQIKGFLKDACGALARVKGTEAKKVRPYKRVIDGTVFVYPRKIPLVFEGEVGTCQRPLRAGGPKGERTALANSETCPAGTEMFFTVEVMEDSYVPLIKELPGYSKKRGFGQWRNSGKGRAVCEIVEIIDGAYED